MDKADIVKELLNLSQRVSRYNKSISWVIYSTAEALKSGEDIFYAIDKLKDQMAVAKDMENVIK